MLFALVVVTISFVLVSKSIPKPDRQKPLKQGTLQAQAIVRDPIPRWVLIYRDPIDQQQTGVPRPPTDTGPGYRRSRKHLTIGNTYVRILIYH
jgi:hypothetical protein